MKLNVKDQSLILSFQEKEGNGAGEEHKESKKENHLITEPVSCLTLQQLLSSYTNLKANVN